VERWYEATGDDLAAKAILRGATTYARTSMGNRPYSYYNCFARVLNRAFRISGDRQFARILERNMRLAVARYYDEGRGRWHDLLGSTCSASNNVYPLGDMAIGMAAITRCGTTSDSIPALQQTGRGRPVVALFRKPEGQEVVLDVRGRYPLRPRVYTMRGEAVTALQLEPFREVISRLEEVERPSSFRLSVPAEQPAGTYILDAGVGGAPWEVTWTSGPNIVLFAPGGVSIGCGATWKGRFYPGATPEAGPVTWHFRVPEAVRKFRVFRSGAVALRDPESQDIPLAEEIPGWSEVTVRPEQAGHLWSLRSPRAAFVELRGVPPVLAAGRSDRFFLPDWGSIPVDLFGMERDYGFTERSALPDDGAFVSTGKGQGVALVAGRAVLIERGKSLGEGRFEHFNCREGTLELWLKPDWSSVYQPRTRAAERMVLSANTWFITLHYGGNLTSLFSVSGAKGRLTDAVGVTLERGRWTHLAYQWYADGDEFVLETYVNGCLQNLGHELTLRHAHWSGRKAAWQPRDIAERIIIGRLSARSRCLDSIVDELRISDVRRYKTDFVPSRGEPAQADGHTLALFRFDGSLDGVRGSGSTQLQAKLLTR